jgi:hypothetical protein
MSLQHRHQLFRCPVICSLLPVFLTFYGPSACNTTTPTGPPWPAAITPARPAGCIDANYPDACFGAFLGTFGVSDSKRSIENELKDTQHRQSAYEAILMIFEFPPDKFPAWTGYENFGESLIEKGMLATIPSGRISDALE